MKQDIPFDPVEGVAIAIAPDDDVLALDSATGWSVWLLNHNDFLLSNVLIVSEGYGTHEGQNVITSKLRYHYDEIGPRQAVRIEPIDPGIFHLTNQYWVSYYRGTQIFDKKYVFVPGALEAENLIAIGMLEGRKGVLHS